MKFSILLRRMAMTLVSLAIAFILTALLVNLSVFDEDLKPEVASILQPVQVPPHEDNAYFAIWGMIATADKDVVETGVRLVERYQHNQEKNDLDTLTAEDYAEILGATSLDEEWKKDYQNCNARIKYGCSAELRTALQNTPIISQRLLLMLERHEHILSMSTYKNSGPSSFLSPLPSYGTAMKLSQIKLANLYNSGTSLDFLKQLAVDIRFWKMLLEQGSELIDKMVGVAGIWADVQHLSEFLTTHELSEDETLLVMSLLTPLTKDELDIGEAFKSEQRTLFLPLTSPNVYTLPGLTPAVANWLTQTNATQNSYYQHITAPMLRLSSLSEAEFTAYIHDSPSGREAIDDMITIWPGSLYNLGGKILLAQLLGSPADYIARVHDVNNMISLVKLQLSSQAEEVVPFESVLSKLKSASPQSSEVLAGKALKYDAEEGWLQFDCLDKPSLCGIKLF